MLYAVRGNKQLKIDEAEKTVYLKQGYDIAEEKEGQLETIEVSPSKTVPYAQYEVLRQENTELKEQLAGADQSKQLEALQKENKALKEKLAEANKKMKEATKE
ncbi:MAG: hypothetical protein ACQEXX_15835 [Bacillota bacterium]